VRLGGGDAVEEPTILFEGFHMVSTNQGSVEWKFTARAAQIYEKANMAKAQDIRIVYWKNGRPGSTLTAKRGFVKSDTHAIRAEQDVVVVSEDGVVLRTERLNWNHQLGKMDTDQPVTVERDGSVLTGVGLRADSGLRQVEILANVQIKVPSVKRLRPLGTPAAEPGAAPAEGGQP